MAKKAKKASAPRRSRSSEKPSSGAKARKSSGAKRKQRGSNAGKSESPKSAVDALVGLLETPLAADVLAAGMAAALAALAQHGFSKKSKSKTVVKAAAAAAAAAIGERLVDEFHEIVAAGKQAKREEA